MKEKYVSKKAFKCGRRNTQQMAKEQDNPYEFYAINAQLLKDAASFSYNTAVGSYTDLMKESRWSSAIADVIPTDRSYKSQAGICAIGLYHTPGVTTYPGASSSGDPLDEAAVNVAKQLFNRVVRHANSGSRNYESSDLMLYALAMAEPYSMHSWMCRLYAIAMDFRQKNRYIPDDIFRSMGVDPSIADTDLSNFRKFINRYAMKINSLAAPRDWTLYSRRSWIYSHVFKDTSSEKSQFYLYYPRTFLRFSATTSSTGGELIAVPFAEPESGKLMSLEDIQGMATSLIRPIIEDEDMNIMSGDIEKAYSDSGLWKLPLITEDTKIEPFFSLVDLAQIQNLVCVGQPFNTATQKVDYSELNVKQFNNQLSFNPSFIQEYGVGAFSKLFTLHLDHVEPGDTIDAAALTVALDIMGESSMYHNYVTELNSCGSEVAACMTYFVRDFSGSQLKLTALHMWENVVIAIDANDESYSSDLTSQFAGVLHVIEEFSMHPSIYVVTPKAMNNSWGLLGVATDVDNYRVMSASDLRGLHECALLSEFNIPTDA